MWVKGRSGRPTPSNAPGTNMRVMGPDASDPYANMSVDTEGVSVIDGQIVAISSVGGSGPDGSTPCTKPRDVSPGCFHLEITASREPLAQDALNKKVRLPFKLPANPAEYPRLITGPDGSTYLMFNSHPIAAAAAPNTGKALTMGYLLIRFPKESLLATPK
jgi:hypothetical protein